MNNLAILWALGLTVLSAHSALAGPCSASGTRTAKFDNGPVRKVVIGAGAGDLVVRGDKTLTLPRAVGNACASTQELLDQIQIETRREGDTLYITARLPELKSRLLGNPSASLDLAIDLPESVETEIEDSSGDLELSGVRSAAVTDGSGDIQVRDIHGDLSVRDSSGDIHIETVTGNARVTDSSGDIDAQDVTGDLEIPTDSSGSMRLRRVAGNVHIDSDSSGDIVIEKVQRDVSVDADSSGDIDVSDVSGNFTVGADSSGDIRHDRVLGKVELPQNRR